MRKYILAGASALALTACADFTIPGVAQPVTPTQQQCVVLNAVAAVKAARVEFADLSYSAKAAFVATNASGIADLCGLDLGVYKGWLDTAIMAAALAE
jgi:hypothetical protein